MRKILNSLLFILATGMVLIYLQSVVGHPDTLRKVNSTNSDDIFSWPRNSVDVLTVSASAAKHALIPPLFYRDYGFSSYIAGVAGSPQETIYYEVKEILNRQTPKVVILDISGIAAERTPYFYRATIDSFPQLSINKMEFVMTAPKEMLGESRLSYIFPISKYHNRYKKLQKSDFITFDAVDNYMVFSGYTHLYGTYNVLNWEPYDDNPNKYNYFAESAFNALKETVEFLQKKGIGVVLVMFPINEETRANIGFHNTVSNYAKSINIDFFDFNYKETSLATKLNFPEDNHDAGHMNLRGAEKVTIFLGEYLFNNFELPDRRTESNPLYVFLEEELYRYNRELNNYDLNHINRLDTYIKKLASDFIDDYTIIFTVQGDGTRKLNDNLREQLANLSMRADLTTSNAFWHNYIVVINNGNVEYELLSANNGNIETDNLSYRGFLPDGKRFLVTSSGLKTNAKCSIIINGTEAAIKKRGLNIVVYDSISQRVVDSVCFDTYRNAGITYYR